MPISDLLAQISGEPSSSPYTSCPVEKRKASNDLSRANDKLARREPTVTNSSRPVAPVKRPQPLEGSVAKAMRSTPSSTPMPTSAKIKSSNVNVPLGSPKPPKKGSFAEIMARAKAGQANLGQIGKISHKPIEKGPSKKEREELKAQKSSQGSRLANGKTVSQSGTPRREGKSGNGDSSTKNLKSLPRGREPEKRIKKAATATTGYAGTARPNLSLGSSNSRPSGPSRPRQSRNGGYGSDSRRYTYASEEDDEEEEEDDHDQGYDSEGSSDMEAAMYEVDEEEDRAARIARHEDAEALKEENKLKREKEEKRRRLAAMARSRR